MSDTLLGRYNATPPTLPDGKSGELQIDANGNLKTTGASTTNAGAAAKTADFDSGGGTDTVTMFGIALPQSGGAVIGGTSGNPIIVKEGVIETATLANVSSSATSVALASSNTTRRGLIIMNDSTQTLYIKFGTAASTTSFTHKVAAGGYYEMPFPIYTAIVTGIWASADGAARVTELS